MFYTEPEAFVSSLESGVSGVVKDEARNYLDGEYGSDYSSVNISYPVFKGNNYAMNYITVGESYSLARVLNEKDNPYGFSTTDSDTHLEKSSEWGAVAYLGYSKYGLKGENIHVNNKSLQNEIPTIYVVTGWAAVNADDGNNINSRLWFTEEGQAGSSTGNITGVYDMSGALHERAASYIANGNANLQEYGDSFVTTKSTEYVTIYEYDSDYDTVEEGTEITDAKRKQASRNNYKQNYEKDGDAIYETSTSGEYQLRESFNADYSCFPEIDNPFITHGARWIDTDRAGMFAFWRNDGAPWYVCGFRAVVCPE